MRLFPDSFAGCFGLTKFTDTDWTYLEVLLLMQHLKVCPVWSVSCLNSSTWWHHYVTVYVALRSQSPSGCRRRPWPLNASVVVWSGSGAQLGRSRTGGRTGTPVERQTNWYSHPGNSSSRRSCLPVHISRPPNVGGLLTNYFTRTPQIELELTRRTVACVVHSRTILCLKLMTLNLP